MSVEMETLTCQDCGVEWERVVVGGRRPTRCYNCKPRSTRYDTEEKRERQRLAVRTSYAKHRELTLKNLAARRSARSPEEVEKGRAYGRAYRQRLDVQARRSLSWAEKNAKRGSLVSRALVDTIDRPTLYSRDAGLCYACGIAVGNTWHLEHLTPLSRGGLHAWDNVAVCCVKCNLSKSAKTLEEFLNITTDDWIRPTETEPLRLLTRGE